MLAIPQNEVFLNYTRTKLFQDLGDHDANVLSIPGFDHRLGDESLLALATIFFGTEHQDKTVVQRGLQKYNCVIQEINLALGDNVRCQSYDVFDAIVTMVLLEVSRCHDQICWKNASVLNFFSSFIFRKKIGAGSTMHVVWSGSWTSEGRHHSCLSRTW